MNKSNKIVLIIVVIIVLAGAAFILLKPEKSKAPSPNKSSDSSLSDSSKPAAVTITYDGNTFTSSGNSVNSGDNVKVVNNSSKELDFDSDPHPVHTDDPELNAGAIAPGESKTFTLTTKGTWGYHNHLDASQKGTITVK